MGDVQSTQQGGTQDAAAEEESRAADHLQTEQNDEHEIFRKSELTSDISRKGDEVKMNGCCEDENGAQGLTLTPTKDAAPEAQANGESRAEVNANDGMHLQITEMDVKQNNINAFGKFFSNIGLKLTINRGSAEKARDDSKNTEVDEETKAEKTEDKTEMNTEHILTAVTQENVTENADGTAETTEEPECKAEKATDTQEQEPPPTSSSGPGDVEIDSPVRKFFTTGIFAGLWKKKEAGDETAERELEEMGGTQVTEVTGRTVEQRHDEGVAAPAAVGEAEQKDDELRDEASAQSPERDVSSSQERDRVQMSPLLRFLSGSSLKRLSMKQRSIKSSEARLCDSGEHPPELPPSEPAPTSAEAAKEEDSAWASFKRFMSPKPRVKKSSQTAEETQQPASVEEPKAEQASEPSSEEGKKRKNSSVSWEAVLCGSGRRRSRKTSDSDDEMSPIDLKHHKEDGRPKSGEESGAENEKETSPSPKQDGTPPEDDGGSTWKSLKRIVTPKRKSREEDEGMKIKNQSDGEGPQENSSFSLMNLLPGRKKQRSDSQGRGSSDEAEKDVASEDEDSETPGVIPLSEFDVDEEQKESSEEEKNVELQQVQVANVNLYFPQDFAEASEKQEDTDEVAELASNLQQLSDIQEEGAITEPGATRASAAEEVEGRDDTVAEDLTEVVSEAMIAAEPGADVTLQDETEMFSALSQLSESAKTSGSATPVPAECDVMETGTVLHQVAEAFSVSLKATPPEPTILEMNRRPEAASTEPELKVEDLEAISGLVSGSLREGVSEATQSHSEGLVPVVATEEESGTAGASLGDVHMISVTQEHMNEGEKQFPAPPVEQDEIKSELTTESRDLEQEVETQRENEELTKHDISDHTEAEDEGQASVQEEDVQDLGKELADALAIEGGIETGEEEIREGSTEMLPLSEANVGAEYAEHQNQEHQEPEEVEGPAEEHSSLEPEVISVDISMCLGTESGGDQPGVETQVILDQLDAHKSVEEPEDLQAEQVSSLKVEEGSVSSHEPKIISEKEATAEMDEDETHETQLLTEAFEGPQELEILRAVPEPPSSEGEVSIVSLETEVISENISKAGRVEDEPRAVTIETDHEGHDVFQTTEEPDVSQRYEDSLELVEASKTDEEPEVLQAVSSLASVETEEKTPREEIVVDENKKETIITEDTIESVEASRTSEEQEVFEEISVSSLEAEETSENLPKEEAGPEETKVETTLNPEDTETVEELEAVRAVHPSPVESEHPSLVKETTCDHVSEEETVLTDTDLQSLDPSEAVEEAEVLEMLHQSLESEETKEETSDNVTEEETATDEPRNETTGAGQTAAEPVDESKLEESSIPPLESEEPPENIHKAEPDTDERKAETALVAEEPELTQTVQVSSLESEDNSTIAEAEITSEIILKEETVPDGSKEELKPYSEITLEPEDPSEAVGEDEVLMALHLKSLESEETKEETPEIISEEETVPHETRDETTGAGQTVIEPVDESKTAEVKELYTVETSSMVTEEIIIAPYEAEETFENILRAESDTDEHKEETMLHIQYSIESEDAARVLQEPEDVMTVLEAESQTLVKEEAAPDEDVTSVVTESIVEEVDYLKTVQTFSFVSEELSIPPLGPEETSEILLEAGLDTDEHKTQPSLFTEIILKEETVPDGSKEELKPHSEITLEPEDPSEAVGEAGVLTALHLKSLESEETKEETPEIISEEETVPHETRDEATVGETSSEPLEASLEAEETSENLPKAEALPEETKEDSSEAVEEAELLEVLHQSIESEETKPNHESKSAEEVEELQTVETSSMVREESNISPYEPEETSDNILTAESDTEEPKVFTEKTSEPKTPEEPELSQTVQQTSVESEDNSIPSAEPQITSEIILKEETCDNVTEEETAPDETRDETTDAGQTGTEPVDESKTAEVKELYTVETSSMVTEEIIIAPYEAEETFENILRAESDTDEHKEETMLHIQYSIESEDAARVLQEPEDVMTVLEAESQTLVKEEAAPDEDVTSVVTESIVEEVDYLKTVQTLSKTADVVEELHIHTTSSPVEYKSSSPLPEAEEVTLDPEDTETDDPEALPAVCPPVESEHPSLVKETTCDQLSEEETVPDEPKEETTTETLDAPKYGEELELQDVTGALSDSEELEVKSNDPEVHLQPVDVQEPEVSKATSLESREEAQVTSEDIPKAETNPEEEDLTVETIDDLNLVEPAEEAEGEHAAEVPVDQSEGEGHVEPSEQTLGSVPQDIQRGQEDSSPEEEFHTLTAGETSEGSVESDETRREAGEQQVATEQVREDRLSRAETETGEDEEPAAPQMDEGHPKDVSGAVTDILMEQTSEALVDTRCSAQVELQAGAPSARDGDEEQTRGGAEEDEDTAEVKVVDTESEGTGEEALVEVEEMGGGGVMGAGCSVAPTAERLPASAEVEEEGGILKEDEAKTQDRKPQVGSEEAREEWELVHVDSRERETLERESNRAELQTDAEGSAPGFEGQQESEVAMETPEAPGRLEPSIPEGAWEGRGDKLDEGKERGSASVQAPEAFQSPPGTEEQAVDQEEFMDAEENVDIQEESAGSFYEVQRPPESPRGGEHVERAGTGREEEAARASATEGDGSEETNKAGEARRIESDDEDFDVALEHPSTTSTTAVSLTG